MIEYMSRETFNEKKQEILAAINLLMSNPKSRKAFRPITVVDESTGELLAEVFAITYGSVVVHRSAGSYKRGKNSSPSVRQGRGSGNRSVAPLTGDPDQRFHILTATSADRSISGRDLTQRLAKGISTYVISEPTEDDRPLSPTAELALWLADHVDEIARSPQAGEIYRQVDQMHDDIVRVLNDE